MFKSSLFTLFIVITLSLFSSACTGWDEEVAFPEDFQNSYTQIIPCEPSQHVKAVSAKTWVSPQGVDVWNQLVEAHQSMMGEMMGGMMGGMMADEGMMPAFAPGTVVVKAQYSDANCSTLAGYTAMEKLDEGASPSLGDWKWQFTDENGSCSDCNAGAGCSGCHSGQPSCTQAPEFFCTSPH